MIQKFKDFKKIVNDSYINKSSINSVNNIISSSIDYFINYNLIYIPLLGSINAGKTNLINDIIGFDLFPKKSTKRSFIIRNINEDNVIFINKIFLREKVKNGEKYFYFYSGQNLSYDIKKSKILLEDLNREYANNKDNFFYEIVTKIKLFDKLNIDEKKKNKICFIDLPGYGTSDFFEKSEIYYNLMSIYSSFIFVIRNLTINDINNQNIINKIFTTAKLGKALSVSNFVKFCIFIINFDKDQIIDEKELNKAYDQLKYTLNLNKTNEININIFFF